MQQEEKRHEDAPMRELWETPKLIIEDVGSATRGGPFTSSPSGDDGWYRS